MRLRRLLLTRAMINNDHINAITVDFLMLSEEKRLLSNLHLMMQYDRETDNVSFMLRNDIKIILICVYVNCLNVFYLI